MMQDLENYDLAYFNMCKEFVKDGKGDVSDFCRKNNLSSEHVKTFTSWLEKTKDNYKKGHKMNQAPLTNMEGYKVDATSENYDALIALGYEDTYMNKEQRLGKYNPTTLFITSDNQEFIIDSSLCEELDLKQAYYHKGHFYDEPYEEDFNIVELINSTDTKEKVPFPELEDIEVEHSIDGDALCVRLDWIEGLIEFFNTGNLSILDQYQIAKLAHENGVDVKCKLKLKIDRRLHKNRPLALAIGKWLDEADEVIELLPTTCLTMISATGKKFITREDGYGNSTVKECTIPDDYIIQDQVIEWMHEYENEEQCKPST